MDQNSRFTRIPRAQHEAANTQLATKLQQALSAASKPNVTTSDLAAEVYVPDMSDFDDPASAAPAPLDNTNALNTQEDTEMNSEQTAQEFAEEEQGISPPDCLVVPDSPNKPFVLEVYKAQCFDCAAFGTGDTVYTKCHFEHGNNDLCPAKSIRVEVVGLQRMVAGKIIKALESGNQAQIATLTTKLNERPPEFVAAVMQEIFKARNS
jgi:hypothetical protein